MNNIYLNLSVTSLLRYKHRLIFLLTKIKLLQLKIYDYKKYNICNSQIKSINNSIKLIDLVLNKRL